METEIDEIRYIIEIVILSKLSFGYSPLNFSKYISYLNFISEELIIDIFKQFDGVFQFKDPIHPKTTYFPGLNFQSQLRRSCLRKEIFFPVLSKSFNSYLPDEHRKVLEKWCRFAPLKKNLCISLQFLGYLKKKKLILIVNEQPKLLASKKCLNRIFSNKFLSVSKFKAPRKTNGNRIKNSLNLFKKGIVRRTFSNSNFNFKDNIRKKFTGKLNRKTLPVDFPFPSFKTSKALILTNFQDMKQNNLNILIEKYSLECPRIKDRLFWYIHSKSFPRLEPKGSEIGTILNWGKIGDSLNLVIESNFRIYSHGFNPKKNKILKIFSDTLYNLGNLFMGELNFRSISRAIKCGLDSNKIIRFLESNLSQLCNRVPKLLINQIILWETQSKKNFLKETLLKLQKTDGSRCVIHR